MAELTSVQRIIRILELLSMGRHLTTADLRREFDEQVSLRTTQRDMQTILQAGIPLICEKNLKKENVWSFPPEYRRMILPRIERNELLTMHILKSFLKSLRQTRIGSDLDTLLNKIEEIAPGEFYMELEGIDQLVWDQDVGYYNYQKTDHILNETIELIISNKWATVTYQRSELEDEKTYDIFPCRIFHYKGVLYVAAYNPYYDKFFSLTLHRIIAIKSAEDQQRPVPDFDLAVFRSNRFGVFTGEVEQIALEIKSDFALYFKDRIWHPSQKIITKKDGTLLLKMEIPISPELVTWILGWHTAIKVTKPKSLIEDITQKLEETLRIYL